LINLRGSRAHHCPGRDKFNRNINAELHRGEMAPQLIRFRSAEETAFRYTEGTMAVLIPG